MNCSDITTLEQAEAKLPSSVLPIDGLRRGEDAVLTKDSLNTIVDGLKSRGIDITDQEQSIKIFKDLATFLCTANKQYKFLLDTINNRSATKAPMSPTTLDSAMKKNVFMLDILTVFRHLNMILKVEGTNQIEGWQNRSEDSTPDMTSIAKSLAKDRDAIEQFSNGGDEVLRRHMIEVTAEKNKIASNNLGFYGFLNIVAVGLIIYAAALNK